jgi:LPXTG-site transpeptidase (sortase) family protein
MSHRPVSFAVTFLALFALTFAFLAMTDSLPDALSQDSSQKVLGSPVSGQDPRGPDFVAQSPETPVRVVARNIGLDAAVVNPATTSVTILDENLMQGAVHYPTSALLGVEGTVLLFGHSSYLPIVYNQHYKTFNGIQNLKAGETVSVYSGTTEYRYAVTSVAVANANEDVIELPAAGKHLVLVTCDSFATKSTRYVVKADFAGAYAL